MYVVVFSYTPVSFTNKTFRHNTTEIFIMTKQDLKSYIYSRKTISMKYFRNYNLYISHVCLFILIDALKVSCFIWLLFLFKSCIAFILHFSMKLHYKFYCPINAYGRGCTSTCQKGLAGHQCALRRCFPGQVIEI